RLINDSMPDHVLNILSKFNDGISTVSILGIAYKGNVDDVRETPSKKLIELLIKNGYRVVANDPIVKKEVIETFNVDSVSYEDSLKSDCIIIMTDHDMYKELKPEQVKDKLVISTKPILDSDKFREAGINFQAIGDIVL
ncbi:MAG: UDP binding domain-containing protein, partial [Methanosphaera sp.]|nr:UDP binding domain-containing protein [Methanosphaera sp.]